MIEKLIADINEYHPEFADYFQQIEIPNKTVLLEEGEVSAHIFFVKDGALRAWTNHNGEDITVQFLFEGQAISAFMGKEPSKYSIESIEPSTIVSISIRDFDNIVNTHARVQGLDD